MLNRNGSKAKQLLLTAAALCLTACGAIGNLVKSPDSSGANRSTASTTNLTNTEAENYATPKSSGGMSVSRFTQAQNNLHDAASYHFNLTTDAIPGSPNPAKHSVADGVYDAKKKHTFQYTVTTDGKPAQEWLIQAGANGENYTKKNGAWTLVEGITDQSSLSVDIVIAAAGMSSLQMKKDGSPNLVGTETVAGEACDHYHFDNRESAKSVADVYISQATGNFVRFDLDDSNNKFRLLIDKINEPVGVDSPQ
jgi:hypothetical protein